MSKEALDKALNRLAKWRTVFAGWQLGTRAKGDPESDAVRDHRELSIMLRAENNALLRVLVDKGLVSVDEYHLALTKEAEQLNVDYQRRFPGFQATDDGLVMNIALARDTMQGWRT